MNPSSWPSYLQKTLQGAEIAPDSCFAKVSGILLRTDDVCNGPRCLWIDAMQCASSGCSTGHINDKVLPLMHFGVCG